MILQSIMGARVWLLLVTATGLLIYAAAAIWTAISVSHLLVQNCFALQPGQYARTYSETALPVLTPGPSSKSRYGFPGALARSPLPVDADRPIRRDFGSPDLPGRQAQRF